MGGVDCCDLFLFASGVIGVKGEGRNEARRLRAIQTHHDGTVLLHISVQTDERLVGLRCLAPSTSPTGSETAPPRSHGELPVGGARVPTFLDVWVHRSAHCHPHAELLFCPYTGRAYGAPRLENRLSRSGST